jgi:hypothetical protein
MQGKGMLLGAVVVLAVLAAVWVRTVHAAGPLDADTMKAALQTATPQENGFIDHVLAMVDAGKLPLDMVESTFLWAKKKPRKKFYYFREGLIRRAADAGITI